MKIKAFLLASFITLGVGMVFAQGAIAGDAVCGGGTTPCTFADLAKIFKKTFLVLLQLALAFVIVMIMWSAVQVMTAQDKAGALAQAKTRLTNVVLGILVITLVASGGYVALLTFFKVDPQFLNAIKSLFSSAHDLIPVVHANAQGTLPNPVPGVNNFIDFIGLIVQLIIRWFVVPVVIFSWAYTGFQYVYAQGNPQKLVDAHKWLLWTVVGTITIMLAEGFTAALRGTFSQLFS
ncbi:MAG: hypothetical protein QG653_574 [Patescibacteria group bacterium]|nr:hypothetical protein [Patescibacteria group bacterium]